MNTELIQINENNIDTAALAALQRAGTILKNGYGIMSRAPWLSIFPGICIMLLVMCLNFMGDGLRDALDVRIRPD